MLVTQGQVSYIGQKLALLGGKSFRNAGCGSFQVRLLNKLTQVTLYSGPLKWQGNLAPHLKSNSYLPIVYIRVEFIRVLGAFK